MKFPFPEKISFSVFHCHGIALVIGSRAFFIATKIHYASSALRKLWCFFSGPRANEATWDFGMRAGLSGNLCLVRVFQDENLVVRSSPSPLATLVPPALPIPPSFGYKSNWTLREILTFSRWVAELGFLGPSASGSLGSREKSDVSSRRLLENASSARRGDFVLSRERGKKDVTSGISFECIFRYVAPVSALFCRLCCFATCFSYREGFYDFSRRKRNFLIRHARFSQFLHQWFCTMCCYFVYEAWRQYLPFAFNWKIFGLQVIVSRTNLSWLFLLFTVDFEYCSFEQNEINKFLFGCFKM